MKNNALKISGWLILLLIWFLISSLNLVNNHILPSPQKTFGSLLEMIENDHLFKNIWFSLKINFLGYFISIGTAIPLGFLLGLNTTTRQMFSQAIDSMRFIPITALGGIFIAVFGLTLATKYNFLAFGIWVYLVPVVVQRIDEVSKTHLQMMQTLGATFWQKVKHVQFPYVISRLSDDIRILVGISWTYVIVAELKNIQGGVGSLIFLGEKQSRPDKVYMCILIIVLIGILQDRIFKWIDKLLFKFKYL